MKELFNLNVDEFIGAIVYEKRDSVSRGTLVAYVDKWAGDDMNALRALKSEVNKSLEDYYNEVRIRVDFYNPLVQKAWELTKHIKKAPDSLYRNPLKTNQWKEALGEAAAQESYDEVAMEMCSDQYYVFMLQEIIVDKITRLEQIQKPKRGRPKKALILLEKCFS